MSGNSPPRTCRLETPSRSARDRHRRTAALGKRQRRERDRAAGDPVSAAPVPERSPVQAGQRERVKRYSAHPRGKRRVHEPRRSPGPGGERAERAGWGSPAPITTGQRRPLAAHVPREVVGMTYSHRFRGAVMARRGWCLGKYQGTVVFETGPNCPKSAGGTQPATCPQFASQRIPAGRFAFSVR
jgi:hypothetical protein